MLVLDATEPVSADSIAADIEGLGLGVVIVDVKKEERDDSTVWVIVEVGGGIEAATNVVVTVKNEISKGDDCTAGVLCQATDVFILTSDDSPSHAHNTRQLPALLMLLMLLAHPCTTVH